MSDHVAAHVPTAYELGRAAFHAGAVRIVPRPILLDCTEAAREWYRGWDTANLAAPVPGMDQLPLDG